MGVTLAQLGLESLPADIRRSLAEQLWDSVADEVARQPLTDVERDELERRIAAADADPNDSIPWETIRAEARTRWNMSI